MDKVDLYPYLPLVQREANDTTGWWAIFQSLIHESIHETVTTKSRYIFHFLKKKKKFAVRLLGPGSLLYNKANGRIAVG